MTLIYQDNNLTAGAWAACGSTRCKVFTLRDVNNFVIYTLLGAVYRYRNKWHREEISEKKDIKMDEISFSLQIVLNYDGLTATYNHH